MSILISLLSQVPSPLDRYKFNTQILSYNSSIANNVKITILEILIFSKQAFLLRSRKKVGQ